MTNKVSGNQRESFSYFIDFLQTVAEKHVFSLPLPTVNRKPQ